VLPPLGQARDAARHHVFGVEQACAQSARRSRRRAGLIGYEEDSRSAASLDRAKTREAQTLASDKPVDEKPVVDHCFFVDAKAPSRSCRRFSGSDRVAKKQGVSRLEAYPLTCSSNTTSCSAKVMFDRVACRSGALDVSSAGQRKGCAAVERPRVDPPSSARYQRYPPLPTLLPRGQRQESHRRVSVATVGLCALSIASAADW
jgi:hypothetical protein